MIGDVNDCIRYLLNQDKAKIFDVNEHKEKRSLNANAYAWVLIGKIADAIKSTKEEVYIHELKRWGQSEKVSVQEHINVSGYFKYYEEIGKGTVQGKTFKHYLIMKGSSEYNTHEMSVFIDGIIADAKELGIETIPDEELRRLLDKWTQ